jgi:hypothetical protein
MCPSIIGKHLRFISLAAASLPRFFVRPAIFRFDYLLSRDITSQDPTLGARVKKPQARQKQRAVLVIDVGGTHVKLLMTGQKESVKIPSNLSMTAAKMVRVVKKTTRSWRYDCIAMGYPGPVINNHPLREPHNLGGGWVGFNFRKAFGHPTKIINDASMQALGSYKGGRMLFLGLGTGLGSAMVIDGVLEPMELAHLFYKHGKTYEDYLGIRGLEKYGKKKWRREVFKVTKILKVALEADYVVLGGGNAARLKKLPPHARLGNNDNAFRGGFRLWSQSNHPAR